MPVAHSGDYVIARLSLSSGRPKAGPGGGDNNRELAAMRPGRRLQMPNSSLSVRAVDAIDCTLARSSALFFGVEKP